MFRALAVSVAFALSPAVFAAPDWVQISGTLDRTAYLDKSSVALSGDAITIEVLRSYDAPINLGVDTETRTELYPHSSAKVQYLVNCSARKVALNAWVLYGGNLGDGEIVWADRQSGPVAFSAPADGEERYALAAACAAKAAMQQSTRNVVEASQ